MACPKFLRSDLNPTAQLGGEWTYVGFNSAAPGPTWPNTPAISLVNVSAGQVYGPGNDNPSINPIGVSEGFYAFDYLIERDALPVGACNDDARIIIEIAKPKCPGVSRSITFCSDVSTVALVDEFEIGSSCGATIGTITGTIIGNPGYSGAPFHFFNPALSPAGTFTVINTTTTTPYSGFTLDCVDCNPSSATLTITVVEVEESDSFTEEVCVGFEETLNMFTISESAVTTGSWYYLSGPNPTQTLLWNGGTITAAQPGDLLSIGASAPLVTSNLAAGAHTFRYVTAAAPCLRYRDVTVDVGAVPEAGIFPTPYTTICGGATCAPLVLNTLVQFETPGGYFSLTTTFTGDLYVSISEAAPVLFNNLNPLDATTFPPSGLPYGSTFRVTSFPGASTITVNTIIYTVENGECVASSQGEFIIQAPNTGMEVITPDEVGCSATPQFLLRDNFTNFRSGGLFRIRYRSNTLFSYTNYTGAAFLNQYIGSPPPPSAVHSLTAAFNPAVAPSGWYEVTYTRYASGSLASLCPECATASWVYTFRISGNPCGCVEQCEIEAEPFLLDVCDPFSDCFSNTYTAFNVGTALGLCLWNGNTSCPVQPDYNWWRMYIRQGPANPTINGVTGGAYAVYPFQPPSVIDWSTTTPGTYVFSYEPIVGTTGGPAYDQGECFTPVEFIITACPPSPCEITITSMVLTGSTLDASVAGCTGTPTYSWTGPNGFTATTQDITVPRPTAADCIVGSPTYTLTATCPDGGGCTSQAVFCVDCGDLSPFFGITETTGDITAAVTNLCATPTYSWSRPNGGGTSTGATITPNNGNGNYVVTAICNGVNSGCTATYTCALSVNIANNGSQLIGSASGCGPVDADYTYAWTGPSGFTSSAKTITPSLSGSYTLTVTCVDSGCVTSASANFTLTCNLGVTISAGGSSLFAFGTGTCTGGTYSFSWNAQPSNVTTVGSSVAYVAGQTYTVTMTCVGGPNSACPAATAVFSCPAFTVNIV